MSLMRHGASTAVFALLTAVLALVAAGEPHVPPQQQPLALLLPDKDTHTKLVLQDDALELLRGQLRETPLPVVSVVGAYRTGKSFLLNELMGVGCSEGFVVGHQRHTQTKGVWIWPRRDSNGTVRIFMDTEGFEGTGQADVYDDRIFAFAALISSVLVYNLAETIKQADIERLAFASQLSQEFWHRAQRTARGGVSSHGASSRSRSSTESDTDGSRRGRREDNDGGGDGGGGGGDGRVLHSKWRPPALLWLVQRDFLEGGSVEAYLHQALQPSEHLDEHSKRLNKVRDALISFDRMRALGLPQPHVHRTELCALPREQYDPGYLRGAAEVKEYVYRHAASHSDGGARVGSEGGEGGEGREGGEGGEGGAGAGGNREGSLRGEELASLITRLVGALNAHDLPSAGSVVDAFNTALVHSNIDRLVESLRALPLPLSEAALQAAFEQRLRAAMERLRDESFGATDATDLEVRARDALRAVADSNFVASQRACDELWGRCEAMLRRGTAAWLPSTARYDAHVLACNRTLEGCVGPAAARFHESLLPQLASEGRTAYRAAYRERLHRAAVALSIVGVLGARFCVRSWLLELVCALGFVLLELLPSLDPLGLSSQLVWGSSRVEHAVDTYERLVFNEYWDLGELLPIGVIASFALYVLRRLVLSRVRRGKHKPEAREQGGGADLAQVVIKGE
jgi:uncharacterized membrane protein YgcG